MEVTKEFRFEAAHRLENHDGKCSRLHGHSYRVEAAFVGDLISSGPKMGMVVDFADISKVCEPIIAALDHRFLMALDNRDFRFVPHMTEVLRREEIVELDIPTSTAEHLAEFIARRIRVNPGLPAGVTLASVTVWETTTGSATWSSADWRSYLTAGE